MKYLFPLILLFASCSSQNDLSPEELFSKTESKNEIHQFIDAWHQAAAVADEDIFFGSIADGGIYLGTDKTERWTKEEFMDWGMKYFERDTAWAFTPYDRSIYFAEGGQIAWFEESLDTWMGPCRG
ncbi:MAG: SnoaL-like domain-containing protein, partial [Flavobacteriales bacterium]|nr:SnoaL-like domain-containing protein [Flavobacteriales bacterium]